MSVRPRFRGTDEVLSREIETIQEIAKVRLRQMTRQLSELDRDLRELRAEKAKRRARVRIAEFVPEALGALDSAGLE